MVLNNQAEVLINFFQLKVYATNNQMKMEIIAFEAIATRLTNSCLSSGDRPDIRPRTADIHRCIVADTAGKVHSFLDLLRRGLDLLHKPVVDLPKLLPKKILSVQFV